MVLSLLNIKCQTCKVKFLEYVKDTWRSIKVDGYTYIFFSHVLKEENFQDFLFAFL